MVTNSGMRRVTIAENSLSEVVSVDINQDTIYNADSEVTVTLIYSEDYSVNESQKTFTNIVQDDDLSIRLSRLESEVSQINEGEPVEFKIVSISGPVQKDIKVNFNIVEDGPATNNLDFVGGYTDGEFPTNIVMPRGQEEITVTLETIDDSSFRGIGRVKLHLLENPNQYVIHEPNNYSTNFVDIIENEPSFSITTVNESIIEGNDLIYMITVDRGLQNAQTVSVELTGDTSFINGAISQAVEFYPATRVKYLNFKTFDNAIHNEFGTVVATIAENPNYGSTISNASIQILDNEAPTLILESDTVSTNEGQYINFKLVADRPFSINLDAQISFDPPELVDDSAIISVLFPASDPDLSHAFLVPVVNNHIHDKLRVLTATLIAGDNYNVNENSNNQVSINIKEDDYPILGITEGGPVDESENAEFIIIANSIPGSGTFIQYTISENGSNFLAVPANQTISEQLNFEIEPDFAFATISIPLDDDELFESDGQISVTLNSSPGYIVAAAPDNTASVEVEDNDTPVLSIAPGLDVNESAGEAIFEIRATKLPSEPLVIDYLVENVSGDFLSSQTARRTTLTFEVEEENEFVAPLAVEIENDQLDEVDGAIRVTLQDNAPDIPNYQLNTASDSVVVNVFDDDVPTISLFSDETEVNEGDTAEFRISSDIVPKSQLPVIVEFSPRRLLDSTYNYQQTITLSSTNYVQQFSIQTAENGFDDGPQQFTARIIDHPSYDVSDLNESISRPFINNDIPTLSLQGNETASEDSNVGILNVLADIHPAKDIIVHYSALNTDGDFLDSSQESVQKLNFTPADSPIGSSTALLEVPLVNDSTNELNGTITITLEADPLDNPTYNVVTSPAKSAILTVLDDDQPEFTISGPSTAIEGELIEFTLAWTNPPLENLEVPINFEPAELITGSNIKYIDILSTWTKLEETIQIQLVDNDTFEREARVLTGSIQAGQNFKISPDQSEIHVDVFDEDQPVISLETDNISVDEGDLMTFRVRSDKALTTDLFVAIEFSPNSMITGESTKIVELLSTNTDLFVEFQVQTVDNEIKTNPQKLIASIKNGNNYAPSTDSNHQVVITVNDNDEKPTYSIAPSSSQLAGIIEGRTAKYAVTASHPIDEEVTLSYELTEVGNFLLTDQNNEISLKPLVQTAEIQVLTDNDGLVENDGAVTVTLIPSAETSIASSPDNEASITIIDNDTLDAPNGQLYSTGFDNRLPRLSLAINTNQHPNGFATSNSPFSFQVISDKYLHSAIPAVNITQVDSGSPSPQNFTTELPVNMISSIVSRTSSGNEMRLTIQPGDGYTVGTPNSISNYSR